MGRKRVTLDDWSRHCERVSITLERNAWQDLLGALRSYIVDKEQESKFYASVEAKRYMSIFLNIDNQLMDHDDGKGADQ